MTLDFTTYIHVFEDNNPSNTTNARPTGAMVLNSSNNAQGGYYFMSLVTGD